MSDMNYAWELMHSIYKAAVLAAEREPVEFLMKPKTENMAASPLDEPHWFTDVVPPKRIKEVEMWVRVAQVAVASLSCPREEAARNIISACLEVIE